MEMGQKRYRILYIDKGSKGGSAVSLYELVKGLNKTAYEPVVLFTEPSPFLEWFKELEIEVIVMGGAPLTNASALSTSNKRDIAASISRYSEFLASVYKDVKELILFVKDAYPVARRISKLIKDKSIDLVHHNANLYGNRDTVLAARIAKTPQVCHVRTLRGFSRIERYLANSVNAFIYISSAVEQTYRTLGIPAHKGHIIHNPINVEAFEQPDHSHELRAELGLNGQNRLISNVGRIDWWKGQDYFLQAMAEVVPTEPHAHALIVGAADDTAQNQAYYQRLKHMVADLELTQHVTFTGFRTDIPQIMQASEIIVHSASEPEPFGRVVAEGMAAGKPVIATAAGGVLDIIKDDTNGLLVPCKDSTAMANAILSLLADKEKSRQIGIAAHQRAIDKFTVQRHVSAIEQVYQHIL